MTLSSQPRIGDLQNTWAHLDLNQGLIPSGNPCITGVF